MRDAKVGAIGVLAAIAALTVVVPSERQLRVTYEQRAEVSEALYLPNPIVVVSLSFGYRKVLANYFWFKAINYFGKHHAGDRDYRWLYHMCTLVITLDPSMLYVYEFGATMLAWEANDADAAIRLLNKGIDTHPRSWKLYYLRGFTYYYFLNDGERAKNDFVRAAELPDVHPIVTRIAAKALALNDDPTQAIEFLEQSLRGEDNSAARAVIMERLRDLHYERDLRTFEAALAQYKVVRGELPDSLEALAPFITREVSLQDPFGGTYQLSVSKDAVVSSSGRKRLVGKRKVYE